MDFQEHQAQYVANFQSSPKIYFLEELVYSGFDFNELEELIFVREFDIRIDHPSLSKSVKNEKPSLEEAIKTFQEYINQTLSIFISRGIPVFTSKTDMNFGQDLIDQLKVSLCFKCSALKSDVYKLIFLEGVTEHSQKTACDYALHKLTEQINRKY